MWRCIAPGSLAWRIFGGVLKQRAECWAMKKCTQQVVLGWSELSCFLHSSSFFVGSKIGKLEYLCLDYAFMAVSCVSRGIDFHCTHHIAGNSMLTPREGRRPKRQFQMQHTSPDILSSTWATKGQSSSFLSFYERNPCISGHLLGQQVSAYCLRGSFLLFYCICNDNCFQSSW